MIQVPSQFALSSHCSILISERRNRIINLLLDGSVMVESTFPEFRQVKNCAAIGKGVNAIWDGSETCQGSPRPCKLAKLKMASVPNAGMGLQFGRLSCEALAPGLEFAAAAVLDLFFVPGAGSAPSVRPALLFS